MYIRVSYDATGCYSVQTVELIVNDTPIANPNPDPLRVCDDNADGLASFDLTLATANILNGLSAAEHTVTYHETLDDAQAGTPAIGGVLAFWNTTPIV